MPSGRNNERYIRIISISLLILTLSGSASAQIMSNTLDKGTVEFGAAYQWFRRDLEPIEPPENNWEVASVNMRYGAFNRLTLSFEGGIWNVEHDDFPGQSFRRYTIGADIGIRLIEISSYWVSFSFHYNELLDVDQSQYDFHKTIRNISACLYAERSFPVLRQSIEAWGGLLYSTVKGETYPWGSSPPVTGESENNFGLEIGAAILIADHFKPFAQLIFVEYAQARVGFSFRL